MMKFLKTLVIGINLLIVACLILQLRAVQLPNAGSKVIVSTNQMVRSSIVISNYPLTVYQIVNPDSLAEFWPVKWSTNLVDWNDYYCVTYSNPYLVITNMNGYPDVFYWIWTSRCFGSSTDGALPVSLKKIYP